MITTKTEPKPLTGSGMDSIETVLVIQPHEAMPMQKSRCRVPSPRRGRRRCLSANARLSGRASSLLFYHEIRCNLQPISSQLHGMDARIIRPHSSAGRNVHRKASVFTRIISGFFHPKPVKFCTVIVSIVTCLATLTSGASYLSSGTNYFTRKSSEVHNSCMQAGFVPHFQRKLKFQTTNYRKVIDTQQSFLYSASTNESKSIDYGTLDKEDTKARSARSIHKLEMENLKGRTVRSMNRQSKKNRKRVKRVNNDKNDSAAVDYQAQNEKKKLRRRPKRVTSNLVKMPPWLSQYENDDQDSLNQPSHDYPQAYSGNQQFKNKNNSRNKDLENAKTQMQRLQLAMSGIFYHPHSTAASSHPHAISYFSPKEIHEVLDSIRVSSNSNPKLMAGCAEFLYLMLTLEEEGVLKSNFMRDPWSDGDGNDYDFASNEFMDEKEPHNKLDGDQHSIITRDVLVAAAFHYCDCVRARKAGIYDYVRQAMEASIDLGMWKELERRQELWLPPAMPDEKEVRMDYGSGTYSSSAEAVNATVDVIPFNDTGIVLKTTNAKATRKSKSAIEEYGKESTKIAAGAARLKRAEIMATTVNAKEGSASVLESQSSASSSSAMKHKANSIKDDSSILRSFLVTLSEDWRSLVIRSAACLYRLKGISRDESQVSNGSVVLSTTAIRTAKDAILVYAPLAQRLGMQRLKSELENTAFELLYKRQYALASSLYRGEIEEMKTIVQVLSSRIEQLLRSDPIFIDQVEDVSVSSRVKEPYSLWKKLLRYRWDAAKKKNKINDSIVGGDDADSADYRSSKSDSMTLSIKWVPDAIALRIILRAMKLSPSEDDESIRTREKMLCYYALKLISDVWPASSANHPKDYIKNPKPNGYQSLHYTASLIIAGEEWPFEVQIRSDEMHRIAEYGVAAHWDYKLKNKALPEDGSSGAKTNGLTALALPAVIEIDTADDADEDASADSIESILTGEPNDSSGETTKKSRIASYIEALTSSRENIVQNNLFVFLSSTRSALDGRIVSVDPSACTVRDVLIKYGVMIEEETTKFKVYQNGIQSAMGEVLSNGDVLTLPGSVIDELCFD